MVPRGYILVFFNRFKSIYSLKRLIPMIPLIITLGEMFWKTTIFLIFQIENGIKIGRRLNNLDLWNQLVKKASKSSKPHTSLIPKNHYQLTKISCRINIFQKYEKHFHSPIYRRSNSLGPTIPSLWDFSKVRVFFIEITTKRISFFVAHSNPTYF